MRRKVVGKNYKKVINLETPKIILPPDKGMDALITDTLEIFGLKGVIQVYLGKLLVRERRISGYHDITREALIKIIQKLKNANILSYACELRCPQCGDITYVLSQESIPVGQGTCNACMCSFELITDVTLCRTT